PIARPPLPREVRAAYLAPYAEDRDAVAEFVADIPAHPGHPSRPALDAIAAGTARLDVPALVLWGPRDPVFQGRYLEDLLRRLPHADVHRFEEAGHLLPEDADVAGTVVRWLRTRLAPAEGPVRAESPLRAESSALTDSAPVTATPRSLTAVLDERRDDEAPAVVALRRDGTETVTWRDLAARVRRLALGLHDAGLRPGDRVSLLITPGVDLTTALFACLRLGAVVVLADQGLGLRGMSRAVRGAA